MITANEAQEQSSQNYNETNLLKRIFNKILSQVALGKFACEYVIEDKEEKKKVIDQLLELEYTVKENLGPENEIFISWI